MKSETEFDEVAAEPGEQAETETTGTDADPRFSGGKLYDGGDLARFQSVDGGESLNGEPAQSPEWGGSDERAAFDPDPSASEAAVADPSAEQGTDEVDDEGRIHDLEEARVHAENEALVQDPDAADQEQEPAQGLDLDREPDIEGVDEPGEASAASEAAPAAELDGADEREMGEMGEMHEDGTGEVAADNADAVAGIAMLDAPYASNGTDMSQASNGTAESYVPSAIPSATNGTNGTASAAGTPVATDSVDYGARWYEIQAGFVDDPLLAATNADHFVEELAGELMARIEERRVAFNAAIGGGTVSTEDLRLAIRQFHALADQLLGVQPALEASSSAV